MAMFFWKNFLDGSMNFLNISHRETTEAQKGHRAAPDFSILAARRPCTGRVSSFSFASFLSFIECAGTRDYGPGHPPLNFHEHQNVSIFMGES